MGEVTAALATRQTFDALVRRVVRETSLNDPTDIAEEAFGRISPDSYGAMLREALRTAVRIEITRHRSAARGSGSMTARREAVAEWSRMLNTIERDANGVWVRLHEFGYDDLIAAAESRERLAAENLEKANQYRTLADLVKRHGVATLGEVPPAEVSAVMAGEAA